MDSIRQKNENVQESKKLSWLDVLKIIVLTVVIRVMIPIINALVGWRAGNIQKEQMETERQRVEWEQQEKENELAPTIIVDNKGTIVLGKYEYTEYELYNSKENLVGGKLEEVNGVVIVSCGDIRVKTLWIKDAVYDDEVPFDSERQKAVIFYKESGKIEKEAAFLKSEINERLCKQGEEGVYKFDIRIGIVFTFEYINENNDMKVQKYIVYPEEEPYCEVLGGVELHCDQYYLEYGREEQGEEYTAVIDETVERILKECKRD